MFNLFKRPRFVDSTYGELVRSRSYWRTSTLLDGTTVSLAIEGNRSEPDPSALSVARNLGSTFALLRNEIGQALLEHYQPYGEALESGEEDCGCPKLGSPNEVWPHATPVFVTCSSDGIAEIGYSVAWDDDHMVGVRIAGDKIVEVCGSTISV